MPDRLARYTVAMVAACLCLAGAFSAVDAAAAESRQLDQLRRRHAELQREHAGKLSDIARQFETLGLPDAAAEALNLAIPQTPEQTARERLPRTVAPAIPAELPAEERSLRTRLRQLREDQSVQLYLLSRQALTAGSVHYAYELLREAARQNPDNDTARRVLGFQRLGDEWLTPFEARMRRTGQVWHEQFGWLPQEHVSRYEAGERQDRGRWISKETDAERHRDFSSPWVIRTEHYVVKTNHSLERGVEVATRLEEFHEFFVNNFAGFFSRPEDLEALFRGRTGRAAESRPYEVHYYRTRDEYNQRLISKIANIGVTNGLYYTDDRIAYFFHDEKLTLDDTLYHEATHQIMYECLPRHREVANQAHFWVVEGFACYMESFRAGREGPTLGDPRHPRIMAARARLLNEGRYVPLGQFAAMGLNEFQSVPYLELQKNYSQAAGMAYFFMHFNSNQYRDALIEHLAQLYHGSGPSRRPAQNLAELTGVPYATLDQQYETFIRGLGEPVATADPLE